jgi:hypothetical protein
MPRTDEVCGKDYNPPPRLVAGIYAGATVGMAVGARTTQRLESVRTVAREGGLPC